MCPGLPAAQRAGAIAESLTRHGIDGVIATNTTLSRSAVEGMEHGAEAGGLSGAPVFELSNTVIRLLRAELGDALPIIGVGGIMQGSDAVAKFEAAAKLVQADPLLAARTVAGKVSSPRPASAAILLKASSLFIEKIILAIFPCGTF